MSINNVDKILSYIYPVSVDRCDHLILNKSLFMVDGCNVCGKCCIHEDLIFLPFEVDEMNKLLIANVELDSSEHLGANLENIRELVSSLKEITVEVNGKLFVLYKSKLPYKTYYFEDRGTLNRCHWDIPVAPGKLGCGIHQVSSLTCKFPHVRFNYSKERKTTHVGLMQYGRNWALKCPIKFVDEFRKETVEQLIFKFKLLAKYCDYFQVDNYCERVIDVLCSVDTVVDVDRVCGKDILLKPSKMRLF